jgi:2-oxoglutarate ferredoxin oxidoreductase subunit alpha
MAGNQHSQEDIPVSIAPRPVEELESVIIRFVGDSGDGMQLTGTEFSKAVGKAGHDFITHPDYPSEIRAPEGTQYGVSGYQVQYSSKQVFSSGDTPNVLVAMNPAALKTNLPDLRKGGTIIVNIDAFVDANLAKAGYTGNPFEDGTLGEYQVFKLRISTLTKNALRDSPLSAKDIDRCRNYYALGVMLCLYSRPIDNEIKSIEKKFSKNPALVEANITALRAGYAFTEASELFPVTYQVKASQPAPGRYRTITGNTAAALGFVAASELSGIPLFLGSYPITPATDILHELAALKHYNVTTFQAEDEISGICSAIGAAYGGVLGMTTTSGPGMALKTEALGLAVMLELPLVIVNVQRGGPSTGLPTKIEQADLLQAVHGRNGECPIPVIASSSPSDCFNCAIEAMRIAVKYMTPVILLSDGGIGNASEPWRIPEVEDLPRIEVKFRTDPNGYQPYARDENLARAWVKPGTPGMEHRIGGLEKDFLTGSISHNPLNHQRMCMVRAAKVAGIAKDIPPSRIDGPPSGDLLVIGWGSTFGSIAQACEKAAEAGKSVAHLHLRYINPLPADLGGILKNYRKVLVPEMNLGQLSKLLREHYLVDCESLGKMQGKPFTVSEIHDRIIELC